MPIYLYKCEKCGHKVEIIQSIVESIVGGIPLCCGKAMSKLPTFPAMVKIKGEGGYPSRRKEFRGTAPYYKT